MLRGFGWASPGNGFTVDVSGSHGLVRMNIARDLLSLRFVVQDLSDVIEDVKKKVPAESV